MVHEYIPADVGLTDLCSMIIFPPPESKLLLPPGPGGGKEIPFQFPPVVTADGKKSQWDEKARPAYEPIVVWNGASAREVTIDMTYIVAGGQWTADNIKNIAREFKRIHYGLIAQRASLPVIIINLYNSIIGSGGKFRISSTSIKYGKTYILERGASAWPLTTKITITGSLVTKVKIPEDILKIDIANLDGLAVPRWY